MKQKFNCISFRIGSCFCQKIKSKSILVKLLTKHLSPSSFIVRRTSTSTVQVIIGFQMFSPYLQIRLLKSWRLLKLNGFSPFSPVIILRPIAWNSSILFSVSFLQHFAKEQWDLRLQVYCNELVLNEPVKACNDNLIECEYISSSCTLNVYSNNREDALNLIGEDLFAYERKINIGNSLGGLWGNLYLFGFNDEGVRGEELLQELLEHLKPISRELQKRQLNRVLNYYLDVAGFLPLTQYNCVSYCFPWKILTNIGTLNSEMEVSSYFCGE